MNKLLTVEQLDALIEKNKEIEIYIESNRNKYDEGWTKLTFDKNFKLNSYKYLDSNNKYRVRRLYNIFWRAWLNKPTKEEKERFSWKEKDRIKTPPSCPFCNTKFPMEINICNFSNLLYKGSAKCSNCKTEIILDGFLSSIDEVYQEIYRICEDKEK